MKNSAKLSHVHGSGSSSSRELDFKMPFDKLKMEKLIESGKTMKEVSEELGVSPSTLREYRHVIEEQEDPTIVPILTGSVMLWKTGIYPSR